MCVKVMDKEIATTNTQQSEGAKEASTKTHTHTHNGIRGFSEYASHRSDDQTQIDINVNAEFQLA